MHLHEKGGEERGQVRFLTAEEIKAKKKHWKGLTPILYNPDGSIANRLRPNQRVVESGVVGSWNDTHAVDDVDGDTATINAPSVGNVKPLDPVVTIDRVIADVAQWVLAAEGNDAVLNARIQMMRGWNPGALAHKTNGEVVEMLRTELMRDRLQNLTQGIYKRMGWDRGATINADGTTLPAGASG